MSDDLVLDDLEASFFDLMQYGAILSLAQYTKARGSAIYWACEVFEPYPGVRHEGTIKRFESSTALGAFMAARAFLVAQRLAGKEIWTEEAKRKRASLGLS